MAPLSATVKSRYPSGSAVLYLFQIQEQKQHDNRGTLLHHARATYDIVNGWLSNPLTLCPLHDVSVVTIRTCGHIAPATPQSEASVTKLKTRHNQAQHAPSS